MGCHFLFQLHIYSIINIHTYITLWSFDLSALTCKNEKLTCYFNLYRSIVDFAGGSDGKASVYKIDLGSIPGLGRFPGEGNGNPLQYYCLENPMDRGTWRLQSMGLQRVEHDWATSLYTDLQCCVCVLYISSFVAFLLDFTWSWYHDICLFLISLSISQSLGPSILYQMAIFQSS